MRKPALMLIGLITLTACSGSSLPDEVATTSLSGTLPATTSTTQTVAGPIRGALPDGTIYDIAFPEPRHEEIVEIRAGLITETNDDEVPLAVDFLRGGDNESPEALSLGAEDWTVKIEVPDSLDSKTRDAISKAIEVSTEVEMPVIALRPPLRWAEPPQVIYETFVVSSGCPGGTAACNPTHAVSVIPRPGETLDDPISIQSYALRPRSDLNYLPPGPLTARWSPDVLWTGGEMIVWGGSANPGPPRLVDGAAYDPATNKWRMLSPPPIDADQGTRAVWAGREMIVIGEEATVAWTPDDDGWRVAGDGITPPLEPGMTVTTGSEVVTWNVDGLFRMRTGGTWDRMPDPGVGTPGRDGSVLRVVGSRLVAIGQDGCDRLVARWGDGEWSKPARISLGPSKPVCGHPNQTAVSGGKLVLWDDTSGKVISYDLSSSATFEERPFPLPMMEHAPGPLHLDDRFLVTAGLDAAIFEPATGVWTTAEVPGMGTDVDMVWTGDEVLMWDKCCYGADDIDAWRWVPPSMRP